MNAQCSRGLFFWMTFFCSICSNAKDTSDLHTALGRCLCLFAIVCPWRAHYMCVGSLRRCCSKTAGWWCVFFFVSLIPKDTPMTFKCKVLFPQRETKTLSNAFWGIIKITKFTPAGQNMSTCHFSLLFVCFHQSVWLSLCRKHNMFFPAIRVHFGNPVITYGNLD